MIQRLSAFLFAALLFGCANAGDRPELVKIPPEPPKSKVGLLMFSAEWCVVCNKELPELDERVKSELAEYGDRLTVTVYVVQDIEHDPPTPSAVDEYKTHLRNKHPSFSLTMVPDPWKGKTYFTYFKKSPKFDLPRAVILVDEKAPQPYPKADLDTIMSELKSALGR
ncbi:MAG: thioredoxin family protein [Deltaproteobacteria bacterium]|nr:thioredoxin family protein [Deltaproteobacteria bacterium]